jgi:membrane associated rhomboid family serine protease
VSDAEDEAKKMATSSAFTQNHSPINVGAFPVPTAHRQIPPHAAASNAEPSAAAYPGLTAIGPVNQRKIKDWALVLQSMSIWHSPQYIPGGWVLLVRDEDYARASTAIDRYEVENRDWPPPRVRERPRHAPSIVVPLLFAALAVFFLVTGPVSTNSIWFQRGHAQSDLVISSEPWRALTALTLHADKSHILGNVISGTIFGAAVQRRLGPGGASLAILASGVLGNVANAVAHHAMGDGNHRSIGASTAVFGAIGILAATQVALDHQHAQGHKRSWLDIAGPVVGGLSLLGALGASPQSDIGAHLFGLLGGLFVGLSVSLVLRKTRPLSRPWLQVALGAVTVGLCFGVWRLAVPYHLIWPL